MILSKINEHERDKYIEFYDYDSDKNNIHLYLVHGYDGPTISVTTLAGRNFKHFDKEKAAKAVVTKAKRLNDPDYEYHNMTEKEVIEKWSNNKAAELGTTMHENIEFFYNGCLLKEEVPDTIEFQYFLLYCRDFPKKYPGWKPYRTEWFVWTNPFKLDNDIIRMITGSIDMTYENEKGEIAIFDWKRVKDLTYIDKQGNRKIKIQKDFDTWNANDRKGPLLDLYGTGPASNVHDSKYHHYSLQLNIYKYILEQYYNKKVVMMNLVVCSPTEKNYLILPVDEMQEIVSKLVYSE